MNKKLILSVGMLAFAGAAVIGGTGAFFTSQTASTGNVFTAGTVDLVIESIDHEYTGSGVQGDQPVFTVVPDVQSPLAFTLDDIKPLDSGDITYGLTNLDNPVHLCVLVEDANDDPSAADSALLGMMNFLFQGQSGSVSSVAGVWQSLGTMGAGPVTENFGVSYCFGVYDDETCVLDDIDYNPAQGGSLMLNLDFYAVQTRNNEDFDCASLNNTWAEPVLSEQNQINKDLNRPHINWTINGPILEIEFVNPSNFSFAFDYRIDDEPGTPDQFSALTISQGELQGTSFGDRFNGVNPGSNNSTTRTFNANSVDEKLEVILRRGAEQNWYLDWITFNVIN